MGRLPCERLIELCIPRALFIWSEAVCPMPIVSGGGQDFFFGLPIHNSWAAHTEHIGSPTDVSAFFDLTDNGKGGEGVLPTKK
jgi:hypothetical protein